MKSSADDLLALVALSSTEVSNNTLRVAVFGGHGTAGPWHGRIDHGSDTVKALAMIDGIKPTIIKQDDFFVTPEFSREAFDVVWFPGGGAHAYGNVIGDAGIAAIRAFVASGGGYVGACAGAYFASACVSSTAHVCFCPAAMVMAVRLVPRSTSARLSPMWLSAEPNESYTPSLLGGYPS